MNRENWEKIIGYFVFALLVLVFFAFGAVALTRAVGIALIGTSVYWFVQGNIPYGIEGREPSGYFAGAAARLISIASALLGVALVVAAPKAACLFGWAQSGSCA